MQINITHHAEPGDSATNIFESILASRGFGTSKERELFLNPEEPTLKSLLKDTGININTLKNIQKNLDLHLMAGNDICVFGDYDADGITATAILWQALVYYGSGKKSRILPFLPDRHRHGYGLSVKAVDEILSGNGFKTTRFPDFSPKLIITVDNGIVAHPAAIALRDRGIDLIITDHHEPTEILPVSNEILHTTVTSGAGVAWILALYLLKENEFSKDLIDLATIGIVADMMPLHGTNRGIIVRGLKNLITTKRPGLVALYEEAKIDPKSISTYTISFGLAPRINAAGRLYDPYDALRLLCATSAGSAMPLAIKINAHNEDRRELTEVALNTLSKENFIHKIVVVVGDYHEGIIGLIAGKLTELTHKPSIVISNHSDTLKASARSIPSINITELLRSLSTPFLSLGGHSQAAGFGLDSSQLDIFLNELYEVADSTILDQLLEPVIKVDFKINPTHITLTLAKLLETLEPFGIGNPKPKFLLEDLVIIEDRKLGSTGKHRKLMIKSGSRALEVMLFNTAEIYPLQKIAKLVASININVWNNKETVQLISNYVEI